MESSRVESYRRWFEYEKDSHRAVLASIRGVPEANRGGPEYRKALDLLGHVAAARGIWLFRLGVAPTPPAEMFPKDLPLEELERLLDSAERGWTAYLAGLSDADLEGHFEYRALDGRRFRSRIDDVLTQLHGHSLYHRGQVATLVRAAGGEPATTDFIYWSREDLPDTA